MYSCTYEIRTTHACLCELQIQSDVYLVVTGGKKIADVLPCSYYFLYLKIKRATAFFGEAKITGAMSECVEGRVGTNEVQERTTTALFMG